MINFQKCFELLTGHEPFVWQIKLYKRFLAGDMPAACDIPTGLGKTSVIVIWLLALAEKFSENAAQAIIPRRLVYVVDRRVIVDQATTEAEKTLAKLVELKDDTDVSSVYQVLRKVAFLDADDQDIIALSTLRGEFADNRKWFLDPSRPAIIVGTIDMIGSRLLFSAYGGVGASYKALQAGLLGQDALFVIDEAHLSPSFMSALGAVRQAVSRKNIIKPFAVMSLSATHQYTEDKFTLETDAPEDLTNEVAAARLNAEKKVIWHKFSVSDETLKSKKVAELLRTQQAQEMAHSAARYKDQPVSVLLFGATVKLVKEIKKHLLETEKLDESQVLLMVGGMRGFERDRLVDNPIFKAFSPYRKRAEQEKAYFLVATSCAEVGVDLDADFAVCDVTAADSFVQRLGRVNRMGKTVSEVTVVFPEALPGQRDEVIATFHTLQEQAGSNGFNASPLALRAIEFGTECYPVQPVWPPLEAARLDDWSMTSLSQEEFRRPLVSYWLRGVTENTTTETSLCWRAELSLANTDKRKIATVKALSVKSRECARELTARAETTLLALAERFPEQRVVVISSGNKYEAVALQELKAFKEKGELFAKLMFATVVLPCEVGGLKDGIALETLPKVVEAVPDAVNGDEWRRVLLTETEDGVTANTIGGAAAFYPDMNIKEVVRDIATSGQKRCVKQIRLGTATPAEDDEVAQHKRVIAYFINRKSPDNYLPNEADNVTATDDGGDPGSVGYEPKQDKKGGAVSLAAHSAHVKKYAQELAEKLHLHKDLAEALALAGLWHDKGKARECWQKAVGNFEYPKQVLAKSEQPWFAHNYNQYYRHEFGSLVEAAEDADLQDHPQRDLILHLIATHHGYARPHFPERAFDKDNPTGFNREIAQEAMLRFARLQIKYGWWQLAYLEAILKAADALASRAAARGEI